MIEFLLVINRQGKVRVGKWYSAVGDTEKRRIVSDVHRLCTTRAESYTNFVDYASNTLVYRRYAGLFVCLCINQGDNELAALEAIQLFVEVLDRHFHGVCELDILLNFWKVYAVVDEIFLAGEIMETSKKVVLERLTEIDKVKD